MDWDAIGAIGEIIGAIAVVLTLFYLAAQIRSQNKESQANAINTLTQQWANITLMFCDADLNRVWQRGLVSFHDLDDNDRGRFSSVSQNLAQTLEGMFLQRDKGRMDTESWAAIERRSRTLFSAPGLQQWWLIRRSWFTDSFQDYLNQLIADLDEQHAYAQFFDRPE